MIKAKSRAFFLFKYVLISNLLYTPSYSTTIEDNQIKMIEVLSSFPGWCSIEKALEIFNLVIETRPSLCVEIGVFGGSSLFPFASALKLLGKGVVVGIDPWDRVEAIKHFNLPEDAEHLAWWGSIDLNRVFLTYSDLISKYCLNEYVITLKSTSKTSSAIINSPIDILHLDGNHSEFGINSDVALYLPKVRTGGSIMINDALSIQTQPALKLLFHSCELVKVIDNGNCLLFKKTDPEDSYEN